MGAKFAVGQRVKIIRVDEIPYGQKYSFLQMTIDKTGVIRGYDAQLSKYVVRLDEDSKLITLSEDALEAVL
jgi:hypothetical protein